MARRGSALGAGHSRGLPILVFIPCLGAYLTPDLLGGGKTVMIGNLVQNQFTTARDWPFGSAVSLLLMAIVDDPADAADSAARRRGAAMKRGLAALRGGALRFLHLPLLVLAVFSFNRRGSRCGRAFRSRWYRAALRDPQLAEAALNSVDHRRRCDGSIHDHRDAVRLRTSGSARDRCFRARCICRWSRRRS